MGDMIGTSNTRNRNHLFFIIRTVTDTKMRIMPIAGARVRVSPRIRIPRITAVRGSRAPKMAVSVLPIRAMAREVKMRETTVGKMPSPRAFIQPLVVAGKVTPPSMMQLRIITRKPPKMT